MNSSLQKAQDGTITLNITIPKSEVAKTKQEVISSLSKSANVPGFRKGKAPKKLIEEKVDEEKLREEILKKLLPTAYFEAVKQHKLNPVLNPKIHIDKIEKNSDWTFQAVTCEAPKIELGDYKKRIAEVSAKSKIIIPGKEQQPVSLDEIVKALLAGVSGEIPSILVEQEVDRLLSQTLDEVKTLGLTLEQYLASTNRTVSSIREEYKSKAQNDIKLEFALQKVADSESITVEDKEIDEAIAKAKNETEREQMIANKYVLASILRQQKTFDYLKNL